MLQDRLSICKGFRVVHSIKQNSHIKLEFLSILINTHFHVLDATVTLLSFGLTASALLLN